MNALLLLLLLSLGAPEPQTATTDEQPLLEFAGIRGVSTYGYTLGNNVFVPPRAKTSGLEIDDRTGHIDLPGLVKAMGIKPGMTLADVGAGSGIFTIPMAQALEGRGQVFATEVDPVQVQRLGQLAVDQKLPVLKPVQVGTRGLDPWYLTQRFDRVFLGSVFQFIADQQGYMRQLRQAMKPDGRLFIFSPIVYPSFSDRRYMNVQGFFDQFVQAKEGFPLWDYLPPELAGKVKSGQELSLDLAGFKAVVGAINRMLADPAFNRKLLEYWNHRVIYYDTGGILTSVQARDAQLFRSLSLHYGWSSPEAGSEDEAYARYTLNHLLLTMLFFGDGRGAGYAFERGLFDSERTLRKKLELAGWQFVATHPVSHFYQTVEFRPAPGGNP
jgi:SAM-dependent methyltransferase